MTKRDDGREFVAFTVSKVDAIELRRLASRMAYPRVEPLAVELFQIGLTVMNERYETPTRLGEHARARQRVMNRDAQQARKVGTSARGTSADTDRERRRDRVLRRRRLDAE